MASLYLGRRAGASGFSRHVAVKVVHPHLAENEKFVRMFVDEAKLCSAIRHPNVVHVEGLGLHEGTHYLVMEYVHGCSLSQLLRTLAKREIKMSSGLAVAIAAEVARGLHAAHETAGEDGRLLRIVHRDVSPQNVLLSYQGHAKLIDFGVAKVHRARRATSKSTGIKGKIRYMAPEQAKAGDLDRRTDVYAVGILLWEMLTMRRLFAAENDLAALSAVREPLHARPSRYAEGLEPALDRAVMKALSTDKEDRPASAKAFRRLLLDACPDARDVEPSDIANLLLAVMRDHIAVQHDALPDDVREVRQVEGQLRRLAEATTAKRDALNTRREEVLSVMTAEFVAGDMFEDDSTDSDALDLIDRPRAGSVHEAETQPLSAIADDGDGDADDAEGYDDGLKTTPWQAESARSRSMAKTIAAGVVAAALGVVLMMIAVYASSEPDAPVETSPVVTEAATESVVVDEQLRPPTEASTGDPSEQVLEPPVETTPAVAPGEGPEGTMVRAGEDEPRPPRGMRRPPPPAEVPSAEPGELPFLESLD